METVASRESSGLPADAAPAQELENPVPAQAADRGVAPSSQAADPLSGNRLQALSGDETRDALGKKFMAEIRDESWAPVAENALSAYLARQPYPEALGSPDIECRATLCSIVTIVDAAVHQAAPSADLQAAMSNMQYDSLGREFVPLTVGLEVDDDLPDQIVMMAIVQSVEPGDPPSP